MNEATRFVTHTEAGQVISLFPMQAGTPNIDWLQQHISLDADLGRLEQAICGGGAGQRRLFWQPYLNGERAPFYSPDARARLFGISPHYHPRRTAARGCLKDWPSPLSMPLQGYPQGGGLYLTGGGAASATVAADYRRLYRTHSGSPAPLTNLSARGAAIWRPVASRRWPRRLPLAQTRYQPRPQAHARYAALYPVYRLLRERMLPVWQASGRPSNLFLRTYNHENPFLPPSMLATLAPSTSWASCWWRGGRWANRNSAPVS
ncbi:hypothetical protein LN650_23430 [Klebsiella pneumoniae subsp. pneumoniae]|nr:hypothetical protein [Klebsiella pneumoniae subsp. pneumoniae]